MSDVAAVFVLRDDGAALLQHRDDKPGLRDAGKWVPPGGHLDPGEPHEDCARRELQEETAYNPKDLYWLTTIRNGPVEHWPAYELTIFWTCYDGVQPVRCLEGQALQFVRREDAARYDIPPYLVQAWDDAIAALAKQANTP
jgi:8-oxo-dGTP pyrophosphatase MutT (NUDIX family)